MKYSTAKWFSKRAIRHPVRAIDVLYTFYLNKEKVREATHPLGGSMLVALPDYGSRVIYLGDTLEPDVIAFMQQVLRDGMVVFDIGANIGYHSITARTLVGNEGKVVAFEPIPSLHYILEKNLGKYENITTDRRAVTDGKEYEIILNFFGIKYSGFSTTTEPRADKKYRRRLPSPEEFLVPAISIDDYVASSGNIPDLMKVDIENGEMNALRGGVETISQHKPYIIMEGGDLSRTEENSTRACQEFLKKIGYSFFEFDDKTSLILPHEIKDAYEEACNILCVSNHRKIK